MRPLWRDARAGVRVVRLTTPEEKEALSRLFEAVAEAEGWRPGPALRQAPARSRCFALEVAGRLAGGLLLALPDAAGGRFTFHALWPEVEIPDPARAAHVAVLALAPPFRGHARLFWPLAVELWRHCVGEGIGTLYLEVTPRVLPLYRRLGWPLTVLGGARPHWGEACHLCALDVPEVAEALLRRSARSPQYRRIIAQAFRVSIGPADAIQPAPGGGRDVSRGAFIDNS